MSDPIDEPCGCTDCEAAVSPAAYLAALLDFILKHVRNNAAAIDLPFLVDTFHQPFVDLPTDCGAVERELHQARICIEVLRRYLGSRPLANADKETALLKAEADYRFAAYAMLLNRIGASFEEIRLVRVETPENRRAVADALGIDLAEPRPDELDRLFLDVDTATPPDRALTEQALEELFGLADSTRDPLSDGPTRGDEQAQIIRWSLERVTWGQDTDPDGVIHLTLTNPDPAIFRVELHRDAQRTILVASGEIATATGIVKLVPESNRRLSGTCEIAFTADTSAISISAIPSLLGWQLKRLRRLWSEQDYPEDAYSEDAVPQLPIIDPDVIGPDDFRHPTPKTFGADRAFDIWLTRRQFVDETLSGLKASREAKGLDETLKQVLGNPLPDLDAWVSVIAKGAPAAALATVTAKVKALHLSVDSFSRLMAIRAKERMAQEDARNDPVSDAEWLETYSILTQAVKMARFDTWRGVEAASVELGLQEFWPSVTDPRQGDWPPLSVASRPLIDPDLVKLTELPDWQAGRQAIDLWNVRKAALAQIAADLRVERDTNGFLAMLRLALGHPRPGNPLQHNPDTLQNDLASADKEVRDAAAAQITADLHLTVDAFTRVMEIKAANDQEDPAGKPVAADWVELFAILTPAHKVKHLYPTWVAEEHQAGLVYWMALKARLPLWRASAETRQAWQQALRVRSQPPTIDPAAMGADDLQRVIPGDAAFDLWKKRSDHVAELHDQLKATRETLDADVIGGGAPTRDPYAASSTHPVPYGAGGAIDSYGVGGGAPDPYTSPSTPAEDAPAPPAVKALDQIVHDALGVGFADLEALEQERQLGQNIEKRLEQLNLASGGFSYLLRIGALARGSQLITESEWETVYATLTQAGIRRDSAQLRAEEQHAFITLGSDWFRIPAELATPLPFLDPFTPRWLSTAQVRREWQDTLQSRMDQEAASGQALRSATSAVEEAVLPLLRDALVVASDAAGATFPEQAEWITARLLLDARSSGGVMTTRVAQAIETLQTLFFELRTGQFRQLSASTIISLVPGDFDEEWKWIGSYATFRSATFVSLYPENILQPSLLRNVTPAFARVITNTRGARIDPDSACQQAEGYAEYFADVCSLQIKATCQAETTMYAGEGCARQAFVAPSLFYMFGLAASGKVYWSAYNPDSAAGQTYWKEVEILSATPGKVERIIGAMPYRKRAPFQVGSGDSQVGQGPAVLSSYIHLFCVTGEPGTQALKLARLNLDEFGIWDPTLYPLMPPPPTTLGSTVDIVPVQTQSRIKPPGLVFHTPSVNKFYFRRLNDEGTGWEAGVGEWDAFLNVVSLGLDPGLKLLQVRAVLSVRGDLWFILRDQHGYNVAMYEIHGHGLTATFVFQINHVGEEIFGAVPGRDSTEGIGVPDLLGSDMYVVSGDSTPPGTRRLVRMTNPPADHPSNPAVADLVDIAPGSGTAPSGRQLWAYTRQQKRFASYMQQYTDVADTFQAVVTIRALPRLASPATIPLHMSAALLQNRRRQVKQAFADNDDASASVLQYLREAYYFVPVHLALALQSAGLYLAALDSFRTVYDFEATIGPPSERNIYYGLELDAQLPDVPIAQHASDWLLDPLDPHKIAATRRYAYTRATIMCIARCLSEFADAEFTLDTGESLARARTLYLTAMSLLDLPELRQALDTCDERVTQLRIQPGADVPPEARAAVNALIDDLTTSGLHANVALVNDLQGILSSRKNLTMRLADARKRVRAARATAPVPKSIGAMVTSAARALKEKHALLLMDPAIELALQEVSSMVSAPEAQP